MPEVLKIPATITHPNHKSWIKVCERERVEIKKTRVILDVTLLQGCMFPSGRDMRNHKPQCVTSWKNSILNYTNVKNSNLKNYKF